MKPFFRLQGGLEMIRDTNLEDVKCARGQAWFHGNQTAPLLFCPKAPWWPWKVSCLWPVEFRGPSAGALWSRL